jgi:spore coat protein U-like protein
MKRQLVVFLCSALLALAAQAQRARPPGICPVRAAECQVSLPIFDFGRQQMSTGTSPIYATNTVTVTCTLSPRTERHAVTVRYTLKAEPAQPTRGMFSGDDVPLVYYLFLDPARTRHWGDGIQYGTHAIEGSFFLDDRNRVGTLAHVIYGKVDGNQFVLPGPKLGAVVNRLEFAADCT